MLLSWKWIVLGVLVSTLFSFGSYHGGHYLGKVEGRAEYKAEVVAAQAEHTKQVKKRYAKIDKTTPFNSDKPAAAKWLRSFTAGR